ncbi:MAG: choice-of-anchor U domain-containing protein, partial [Aquificaceae bacterium]
AGNPAGGLSLKQNRFATTLTISYSKPLNPRAKVFACTSGGCIDITNLVTIDTNRNSITVRVEDGGIMDEDGQINGEIKTKDFVYAVVPEEYRKSGGCAIGGGVSPVNLLLWLLLPLLMLARRVKRV